MIGKDLIRCVCESVGLQNSQENEGFIEAKVSSGLKGLCGHESNEKNSSDN